MLGCSLSSIEIRSNKSNDDESTIIDTEIQ